jgi:hypothetical protein
MTIHDNVTNWRDLEGSLSSAAASAHRSIWAQ